MTNFPAQHGPRRSPRATAERRAAIRRVACPYCGEAGPVCVDRNGYPLHGTFHKARRDAAAAAGYTR